MRVLMLDNYDSFTFNLVQYMQALGAEVLTRRNDEIAADEARGMGLSHIVISPGPGRPEHAGRTVEFVETFAGELPILGVCLGCQAMAQVWGAPVRHARELMHGKPSPITHDGKGVFAGVPQGCEVGRYHSLAVFEHELSPEFEVSARLIEGPETSTDTSTNANADANTQAGQETNTGDGPTIGDGDARVGEVMAMRHRTLPLEAVQFHPESVLTPHGYRMLANFLGIELPEGPPPIFAGVHAVPRVEVML